jgi:glycerophosphoryl diester phosphodiesterase
MAEIEFSNRPSIEINTGDTPGAQGPTGKSAYQIAVENGFAGTEVQFGEMMVAVSGSLGTIAADKTLTLGYKNAAETAKTGAEAIFDAINYKIIDLGDGSFSIEDENGHVGLKVDNTGKLIVSNIQIGSSTFKTVTNDTILWGVADEETASLFFVDLLYRLNVKAIVANDILLGSAGKNSIHTGIRLFGGGFADYLMVISYGQSNSIGGGSGQISPIGEIYDSLTTADGQRTGNGQFVAYYTDGVTTPLLGVFNKFIDLIKSNALLNYTDKGFKFIGVAPGQGSTTAANLSKGTAPYTKLISNVTNAVANATLEKKRLKVPCITWTQGENEVDDATTYAAYMATMAQLIIDLNADVKALTGQKQNIPLIGYQVAKHNWNADYQKIGKAHFDLGITNDLFICACPSYQFDYIIEGSSGGAGGFIVHFTPEARLQYGAYLALAAYKMIVDGKKFKPLHIENTVIDGNDIYLHYHLPNGAITTDVTLVQNNGNFGFSISGTTISSVKIVGKDVIKITCAGSPVGQTLNYNKNQNDYYIMDYPNLKGKFRGGNIRDKQGDNVKYGTFPLHNWAVNQTITL